MLISPKPSHPDLRSNQSDTSPYRSYKEVFGNSSLNQPKGVCTAEWSSFRRSHGGQQEVLLPASEQGSTQSWA